MREQEPSSAVAHDDEGHGRQIRSFGGDAEVWPFTPQRAAAGDDKGRPGSGVIEALPKYLEEIGKTPLLTASETVALAEAIEKGELARAELQRDGIAIPPPKTELEKNAAAFDAAKEHPQLIFEQPLDAEKQALFEAVGRGDEARKKLTEANLRLVVSVARRYQNRGVPLGDLIQEGNMGLSRAVEKFDYRRGFRFSTYATWWVRQAVTRAIADHARTIRLPVHVSEFLQKLNKAEQALRESFGREPMPEEVAVLLETSVEKIRDMQNATRMPLSLEQSVGDEKDAATLADFVEDEHAPDMAKEASDSLMRDQVEEVLDTLTPRERRVIQLRYGLGDERNRTLLEVGNELGVTRERIRQIEAEAMKKLRHSSRRNRLQEISE